MHQLAKIPTKSNRDKKNSLLHLAPPSDIRDEEMVDPPHELIPPHEGPEIANTTLRTPSPAPVVDQAVDKQAESNDDQPSSQARYSESYPHSAGVPIRKDKTEFERVCDSDRAAGRQPWEPFLNKNEWELATWMVKNVNQRATEQYLNLPMVSV